MDEQKWIKSILAGDTQCFSCLVEKYLQMAFSIAFRILENREEAEEVVQDAFVRMYRALPTFQFGSKFSTWFYKIVYNAAISAQRKQFQFTGYDEAASGDLTENEIDNAASIMERKDRKEIIDRVLKKLPSEDALLLTLYYLEECSIEDIRQITNLTPSNIKIKLFRGRKRFYEMMQLIMKNETADIL